MAATSAVSGLVKNRSQGAWLGWEGGVCSTVLAIFACDFSAPLMYLLIVDILIVFSCSFLGSPIGQRPDQVVITKMKFDLRPGVTCDDDVFILMLGCYSTSVFFLPAAIVLLFF